MSRIATDLLRIFAVTCIVFNHASWPLFVSSAGAGAGMHAHLAALVNQLGKPSVLFFLFLSGLAFSGRREKLSVGQFYRSRLLRIIPAFLLFSLLFALHSGQPLRWIDPILWLLGGTAHYHLYFVAVLLYLYLLYPLLREIPYRPQHLLMVFGLGLALHIINSLRYHSVLPIIMGFRLSDMGDLSLHQPGTQDNAISVVWTEYLAWALPFFLAGLWLPEMVKRHSWLRIAWPGKAQSSSTSDPATNPLAGNAPESNAPKPISAIISYISRGWTALRSLSWSNATNLTVRFALVIAAFLFVMNDFVAGYSTGLHPDPAGRVWRISVGLYGIALILFLLALPEKSSPPWLKKLSRASFLVYLLHPLWIEATRFLHPWYQTQLVIPLSWITALALHELALAVPMAGILLGEGDRVHLGGRKEHPKEISRK